MQDVASLLDQARDDLMQAMDLHQLDQVRIKYLGKQGLITQLLKNVNTMPAEQKREVGRDLNVAKQTIVNLIEEKGAILEEETLKRQLLESSVDVTLPGRG